MNSSNFTNQEEQLNCCFEFSTIESSRYNTSLIIVGNYLYKKKLFKNGNCYYKCVNHIYCASRVIHYSNQHCVKITSLHSNPPNLLELEKIKFIQELKDASKSISQSLRQIFDTNSVQNRAISIFSLIKWFL